MSEEKRGASPEDKLDALCCRVDELENTVAQAEADAKKRANHYPWSVLILAAVLLTAAVANQCSSDARNNAAAAARQEDQHEHEREMQEAEQKREREAKPRKTE